MLANRGAIASGKAAHDCETGEQAGELAYNVAKEWREEWARQHPDWAAAPGP